MMFESSCPRCKFPKVADALHELQTNRAKFRSAEPEPLPPEAQSKDDEMRLIHTWA